MPTQKPKKYQRVRVSWDDANSCAEWVGLDALPPLAKVVTMGLLVRKTKKSITLAGSHAQNGNGEDGKSDFGEVITIPRACVTKIEVLKDG